jgi:muconate cycloisomerase
VSALEISALETTIVDLPSRRPFAFAGTTMHHQSVVITRMRTKGGVEGVGESVVPGGPWRSGESVETMKAMIDGYIAPAILGQSAARPRTVMAQVGERVARARFAKAGVEMALWDILGRAANRSLSDLLGGARRDRLPIIWALDAAPAEELVRQIDERLEAGYRGLKFKMGGRSAEEDVERMQAILKHVPTGLTVIVDGNGTWNELTAARWLPVLADAGVTLVEQPVPGWDLDGMARLSTRLPIPIMADESVYTSHDAYEVARRGAARAYSIKIPKVGGIGPAQEVAVIAHAAGVACYGGSTMESSITAAASAQLYATWQDMSAGCELFGPQLLEDDLVEDAVQYRDGEVIVPSGPGIGVTLDEGKLRQYARR